MSHKDIQMLARDRAHFDRLMTWATGVFGRQDGETLDDMRITLFQRSASLAKSDGNDEAKVDAVLAEIGFWSVIDNMLEQIELAKGPR